LKIWQYLHVEVDDLVVEPVQAAQGLQVLSADGDVECVDQNLETM
jgi:hypothetical protein